ncbi:MAG: HlyD family secretion protein [Verrucomicrobium sp.]|nr:HlyD family secretion protein [Verrucomicrobium sp.]
MTSVPKKQNAWQKLPPERRRKILIVLGAVAGAAVLVWALDLFLHEETDDAYVTGHVHYVSARISGTVQEVKVDDNELVQEGQELVKIDPAEYDATLRQRKGEEERARLNFERDKSLLEGEAVSKEEWEQDKSTLETAQAQLTWAQLQKDYTTVRAPASGRVGRKNVEVGLHIEAGQTLLAVVEPDLWVVANFKETQLAHMRAGQKVKMTIDAIPGHTFTGVVDSFSPASGNQFALLPADNSTGNFTKIVQRVPVKIRFDAESTKGYEDRLRAGLSVIVKVRT